MCMADKMSKRWIFPSVVAVSVIAAVLIGGVGFGGQIGTDTITPEKKSDYAIFPMEVPTELNFSGERVPLEQFDVYEALDREILSNAYFHSQTIRLIKMANRYFPVIEPILKEQGIPGDFKYLAVAESGLANAVSPANAVGFWQLRKGTAEEYGLEVNSEIDERYHLEKSTVAACKYLNESYEKYGNWTTSAASYNIGRRGIDREMARQKNENYYDLLLNEETARYLFRILALKLILEEPAAYGFQISKKDLYNPVPYRIFELSNPVVDFADLAIEQGTNYKMLKFLNPWLRDIKLANKTGKKYLVKIPEDGFRDPESIVTEKSEEIIVVD